MSHSSGPRTRPSTACALAIALTGCISATPRGTPLYPAAGPTRDVSEVAQLIGEVASVDGQSTSSGLNSFELLPGCHVVTTRTSWGKRDESGAMFGNMPRFSFAIMMVANRSYHFEYDLMNRTGSGGTLALKVYEKDVDGNVLAEFQPAATQAELDRCQALREPGVEARSRS